MSATGNLAARLAALEQQVATLRSQAGGGEQLFPNYLTVNAQGQVGANFTGLINALGLVIPAATALPAGAQNRIVWERASDGAVVAQLYGYSNDTSHSRLGALEAVALDTADLPRAILGARDDQGNPQASITVTQQNRGATATILLQAAGQNPTLLDGAGASSFLQLLAAQQLQLALGTGTFVFTASTVSAAVAIAHGIGRTPAVCLASCEGVGFTASVARGNPNNTFTGFTNAATTANITFDWIAIG